MLTSKIVRSLFIHLAFLALILPGNQVYAQSTNAAPMPPATVSPPPAAAPASASLLSNSDFLVATSNPTWPDNWSRPQGAVWQTENGIHFVRLTSTSPGATVLMYRRMELPNPLPPGIELRVRVRYSDVKVGKNSWFDARIMGNFKTASGGNIKKGGGLPAPAFKGTSTEWVDKSIFARIPPRAHFLDIMPCLLQAASGTLDLARVEVFTATEDQLPKPPPVIASTTMVPANPATLPPELHVDGRQLKTAGGKVVWLQGLCLDSMEWGAGGEHIQQSIPVAIEQWRSNVIRLPVKDNFWFGTGPWQKQATGGIPYRQLVDAAIDAANTRGAYLVLDLHCFGPPTDDAIKFWKDAAVRYKNNPGVIFELWNEPHSMSWKVWRDGGLLNSAENGHTDLNAKENNQTDDDESTPGMQALVDAVRSTGARNLIIAGGLDWGYDLSGVATNFALQDKPGNDGIMYSSHIYPWKHDWQKNTLDAAAKYPIFVGEVGTPPSWKGYDFIPVTERAEDLSKSDWATDMIGLIQKYKLNWTGFSFHPKCGPMAIQDWNYTPTPYWGVYVKEALAGQQFDVKKMR